MQQDWSSLLPIGPDRTEAMVVTDGKGNITWANPGFLRLTDYKLEEVIGYRPGHLLQGRETDSRVVESLHVAIGLGLEIGVVIRNYTKQGQPYDVTLAICPLLDPGGAIQNFVAIARPVKLSNVVALQATQARVLIRLADVLRLHVRCQSADVPVTPRRGPSSPAEIPGRRIQL